MSQIQNERIARMLLMEIAGGADPEAVAASFTPDVSFEIAGDEGALPWIGHRIGRGAVADFFRNAGNLIERISFDVEDVLTSDARAVIVGSLTTRVKATGRVIESAFAIILTVAEGETISRFQMLEDSFEVSWAARP
jgi:ketosteroid isomerase-like protein